MEQEYDVMKLAKSKEGSADGIFPIFHHETRRDNAASDEAGKAVYKAVPYVEIIAPGNDRERINRAVKEEDKERWPEQWRRFIEGKEEPVFDGMPISEWPQADVHLERTLRESNIFTVEQLANVADVDVQMLGPGMMTLKGKAQKWVKNKSSQNEELEAAKERIAELEVAIEQLSTSTDVELVVKSGGWYTFRGEKLRKVDLPSNVQERLKELEK